MNKQYDPLLAVATKVAHAPESEKLPALSDAVDDLRPFVSAGAVQPTDAVARIFEIADRYGLSGEPGSDAADAIDEIARRVKEPLPPPAGNGSSSGMHVDQAQPPIVPLVFESAASWRGLPLPPMRYLATNRIPDADVTILSGDGGQGKTTIAGQLAVSVTAGLGDWLGTTCEQGDVMFFSGEESRHTLRLKLKPICAARGVDPDDLAGLSFHFPEVPLLGTARKDGTIGPTPTMRAFEAAVIAARPALVIVDSVAAVFGGNYIDRVQVRTFVSMLRRMAEAAGCAVLLLDHPSLSGMQNGSGRSGSMDWRNAVRAFMYLRPTDNEDGSKGRELEVMKINSGEAGEIQKLRWEAGCFVLEGSASAPQQAAKHSSADQRYLECLDAIVNQGRHVFAMPGRGYAPKVFAEMAQAAGTTWLAFRAAQERLFNNGSIDNVAFGSPSRGLKKIARKSTGGGSI